MFAVKNLSYKYSLQPVLNGLSFDVARSENLAVIGKSGVGKTTLLHLMAGLLKAQSGEIIFENTDIATLTEPQLDRFRANNIGFIFQQFHLIQSLTALENVMLAAIFSGKDITRETVQEIFGRLDIAGCINKKPSQLSIGQKQRVAIARALANQPKIIFADEPTSNLDDENAENTINLLLEYATESAASLVVVTHDSRIKDKFVNILELK